jgi:hypothetical protein
MPHMILQVWPENQPTLNVMALPQKQFGLPTLCGKRTRRCFTYKDFTFCIELRIVIITIIIIQGGDHLKKKSHLHFRGTRYGSCPQTACSD